MTHDDTLHPVDADRWSQIATTSNAVNEPPSPYKTRYPDRQTTRLRGYDYSRPGAYFITICTHGRKCLFGDIEDGRMCLNALGRVAETEWRRSEEIRAEIALDAFVVMPNHLHGIVVIVPPGTDAPPDPHTYDVSIGEHTAGTHDPDDSNVGPHGRAATSHGGAAEIDDPDDSGTGPHGRAALRRPPKSLGSFVAGFKSAATKRINILRNTPGAPVWQYKYHDRIIRDEREWHAVRRYIDDNPARWEEDRNNPRNQ